MTYKTACTCVQSNQHLFRHLQRSHIITVIHYSLENSLEINETNYQISGHFTGFVHPSVRHELC